MHPLVNNTQEFRDEVLEALTRLEVKAEERHTSTTGWLQKLDDRLTSGEACVAGAKHETRLDEHEREIEKLRRPARRAVALAGAGGISIVALIELARQVWGALNK